MRICFETGSKPETVGFRVRFVEISLLQWTKSIMTIKKKSGNKVEGKNKQKTIFFAFQTG